MTHQVNLQANFFYETKLQGTEAQSKLSVRAIDSLPWSRPIAFIS